MSVSYNPATNSTANPPVELTASPAASSYLGDVAHREVGHLSVSDVVVNESAGTVMIEVMRSGALDGEVSVDVETIGGSATQGVDFTMTSDSLTWLDGESGVRSMEVPIINNPEVEGLEQFSVVVDWLSGPANFDGGQLSESATVSIIETSFDLWRLTQFGAIELGEGAESEGDGVSGHCALTMGARPRSGSSFFMPPSSQNGPWNVRKISGSLDCEESGRNHSEVRLGFGRGGLAFGGLLVGGDPVQGRGLRGNADGE